MNPTQLFNAIKTLYEAYLVELTLENTGEVIGSVESAAALVNAELNLFDALPPYMLTQQEKKIKARESDVWLFMAENTLLGLISNDYGFTFIDRIVSMYRKNNPQLETVFLDEAIKAQCQADKRRIAHKQSHPEHYEVQLMYPPLGNSELVKSTQPREEHAGFESNPGHVANLKSLILLHHQEFAEMFARKRKANAEDTIKQLKEFEHQPVYHNIYLGGVGKPDPA